jgi:hypothetical protein
MARGTLTVAAGFAPRFPQYRSEQTAVSGQIRRRRVDLSSRFPALNKREKDDGAVIEAARKN